MDVFLDWDLLGRMLILLDIEKLMSNADMGLAANDE